MKSSASVFLAVVGALLLAAPAQATLILLSHTHTATATYSDSTGASLTYSNHYVETFPAPNATDTFNGGANTQGGYVGQTSSFGPAQLDLQLSATVFLDATVLPPSSPYGRWAENEVTATSQVEFRILSPTYVHVTGYRDRGLWGLWNYSLAGPSGAIPLNFTYPLFYNNYMDQFNLLPAGDYTLTGSVALGVLVFGNSYDGSHTRLNLHVATVPDSGASLGLLLLGLGSPWLFHRCTRLRRSG